MRKHSGGKSKIKLKVDPASGALVDDNLLHSATDRNQHICLKSMICGTFPCPTNAVQFQRWTATVLSKVTRALYCVLSFHCAVFNMHSLEIFNGTEKNVLFFRLQIFTPCCKLPGGQIESNIIGASDMELLTRIWCIPSYQILGVLGKVSSIKLLKYRVSSWTQPKTLFPTK